MTLIRDNGRQGNATLAVDRRAIESSVHHATFGTELDRVGGGGGGCDRSGHGGVRRGDGRRADHNHGCGAAVLASRARLLERAVCDLAEGIEDHYSRHPWFVRLLQESQTLSAFTRRYVQKVATDPNPVCLLAEIQNVCDQFQRTERLMNAIGVPACVRADLARVDAVIERIERDLQPVRGRSFPAITNGVGAWTPDHGQIFGWQDEIQPAPAIPRNGGFVPKTA